MLDLIIKNGSSYIDGELKELNIGIKDSKIVEIGKIVTETKNILENKPAKFTFISFMKS